MQSRLKTSRSPQMLSANTTVTHSSADWWDILLPLAQTSDRMVLVSPPIATGKAG